MKKYTYLVVSVLVFLITSCNTNNKNTTITDDAFYEEISKGTKEEQLHRIDSILNISKEKHSKLGVLYLRKGFLVSELSKHKQAIDYYQKALTIFKKNKNKKYVAKATFRIGSTNVRLSNISLANEYLLQALKLSKESKYEKLEKDIYSSLAHIYFKHQQYDKAIYELKNIVEIEEKNKDSARLSIVYNNIAVVYKNQKKYKTALKYNLKSLDLNIMLNDKASISKSYNNLGSVYQSMLFSNRVEDSKVLDNTWKLVDNKASYKEKAISFYKKAIVLNKEIKSANVNPHYGLGQFYFKNNELEKAEEVFLEILRNKNLSIQLEKRISIYEFLFDISIIKEDSKKTMSYKSDLIYLSSLINEQIADEKIAFVENEYKALTRENKLQQQNEINEKNRIVFITLILALLLLLAFLYQHTRNNKLQLIQEKLALEQDLLRSQMNPHFIFNALSAIQNLVLDNKPVESSLHISRFAKLMRYNFELINEKTISLEFEIDGLKNYMDTQKMRYKDMFDYKINITDVDVHDVEIPPLLLQPFIENAIEHGFKNIDSKGKITINISKKEGAICYEIIDNGNGGVNEKNDGKLHAIDVFKKRLKLLNNNDEASFKINSSKKGTTVNFNIKQC